MLEHSQRLQCKDVTNPHNTNYHQHNRPEQSQPGDLERALEPFRIGVGAYRRAIEAAERVLQEERGADGADQGRERGDVAERAIADTLDRKRDDRAHHHREREVG